MTEQAFTNNICQKMNHVSADFTVEVSKRHKLGKRVIDLAMINPDLPPPQLMIDRLTEAVLKGHNHRYSVSRGIRKLREAFAEKYQKSFAVSLDPEKNICASAGAKDALFTALKILRGRCADIFLPDPCYPAFRFAALLQGYRIHSYSVNRFFSGDLEELKELYRKYPSAILLCNSPHNPTSIWFKSELLDPLKQLVAANDGILINDFTYGEMCFSDEVPVSALSGSSERTIELLSLSKAYSVPGWRIGCIAGDEEIISQISQYKSFRDYGLFLPLQIASASALLEEGLCSSIREEYYDRARLVSSGLNKLGWVAPQPLSGCSVWARLPDAVSNPHQFLLRLLREQGIYLSPGDLYGDSWGRYARIALVRSPEVLMEVLGVVATFQEQFDLGRNSELEFAHRSTHS